MVKFAESKFQQQTTRQRSLIRKQHASGKAHALMKLDWYISLLCEGWPTIFPSLSLPQTAHITMETKIKWQGYCSWGVNPCPRNFHIPGAQPKKNKTKQKAIKVYNVIYTLLCQVYPNKTGGRRRKKRGVRKYQFFNKSVGTLSIYGRRKTSLCCSILWNHLQRKRRSRKLKIMNLPNYQKENIQATKQSPQIIKIKTPIKN